MITNKQTNADENLTSFVEVKKNYDRIHAISTYALIFENRRE